MHGQGARPCRLSLVVPTRNEAANVEVLVKRLDNALADLEGQWEVLLVDDSEDGTAQVAETMAAQGYPVRILHRRPGARPGGLGGAVKEGFSLARGDVIAVMDADLQHPPEVVPDLVAPVLAGRVDLVAGSRYGAGGETGGLDGAWRHLVSRGARAAAHALVPRSRALEDPLGGLFALRRAVVVGAPLQPDGYKVLLEVAAAGHWHTSLNVAYKFSPRYGGRSKAGARQGLIFVRHLLRLWVRGDQGRH